MCIIGSSQLFVKSSTHIIPKPPFSDLVPDDFLLLNKIKWLVPGLLFATIEYIKIVWKKLFKAIAEKYYSERIYIL